MRLTLHVRKLLCILCIAVTFFISNSFIYETETILKSMNTTIYATSIRDSGNIESDTNSEIKADEWIEDSEVSTKEERTDYGDVDENETFTLDDVMDAQSDTREQTHAGTDKTPIFHKTDWNLVLINKQHSIPDDYQFTLGTIKGSMKCDERIIPELTELLQAAKDDGITLVICSPYRDYNRQIVLFNRKIKAYMKKKMTYMEAYKITAQAVTVPGASEHQIGLALDIISDTYSSLNEGFGDTEAGKWLLQNSYRFGFILRYPKGKEDITGIEYEPWHFRYVGKSAAEEINKKGITLEEFYNSLD